MSQVITDNQNYSDIADAIRGKNGSQSTYRPSQMAAAISAIQNTYEASDEGKVVSSGALVAQTSRSVNANGTYDTTNNNSVTVNVPPASVTGIHGYASVDAQLGLPYTITTSAVGQLL